MFTESGLYPAQPNGHQLSLHLPARRRRSRTRFRRVTIDSASASIDGGPYPCVVAKGRSTSSRTRRPTSRAVTRSRPGSRSSIRARTTSTRSTSTRFRAARTTRTVQFEFLNNSGTARLRGWASRHGTGPLQQLRRDRRARVHQVAGARRPTSSSRTRGSRRSNLTIEGGVRWAIWPPWYSTTNNIANFDPRFYDAANAPVVSPATGRLVSRPSL